jgi:hypothetical protein
LRSREFELFAKLEMPAQGEVDARVWSRRIAVRAELTSGLEVRAVFTAEAKSESLCLGA